MRHVSWFRLEILENFLLYFLQNLCSEFPGPGYAEAIQILKMSLTIIRRIACEKDNSRIVPTGPRDELQKLRLSGLYELLVVLRILLTLNFQTGWINQEEFSNSLEVFAGNFYEILLKHPCEGEIC